MEGWKKGWDRGGKIEKKKTTHKRQNSKDGLSDRSSISILTLRADW